MSELEQRVTELLSQAIAGEKNALAELLPILYEDLRKRAVAYMGSERRDHTLQPTALVHEAYLRLVAQHAPGWQNRSHFLAVASQTMRRVLVEHARARNRSKRSGGWQRVALPEGLIDGRDEVDLVEIDDALQKLSAHDERLARVVEMRYFGGLSVEEVAHVLEVDPRTVKRLWRAARTLLVDTLGGE